MATRQVGRVVMGGVCCHCPGLHWLGEGWMLELSSSSPPRGEARVAPYPLLLQVNTMLPNRACECPVIWGINRVLTGQVRESAKSWALTGTCLLTITGTCWTLVEEQPPLVLSTAQAGSSLSRRWWDGGHGLYSHRTPGRSPKWGHCPLLVLRCL